MLPSVLLRVDDLDERRSFTSDEAEEQGPILLLADVEVTATFTTQEKDQSLMFRNLFNEIRRALRNN